MQILGRSKRTRRSSRRSSQEDDEDEISEREDNVGDEDQTIPRLFPYTDDTPIDIQIPKLAEKDRVAFDSLSVEQQSRAVQTVVRLFIMRGSRNEFVNRRHIIDSLAEVDLSLKKHTNAAIHKANQVLKDIIGCSICPGNTTPSNQTADNSKLFLINSIKAPQLREILAETDRDAPFKGFCMVVFQAIWTSPGKKISPLNLLKCLRSVDTRFPETYIEDYGSNKRKITRTNIAIPELGGDFSSLMSRMEKEGYIEIEKEEQINTELDVRVTYNFGIRFYIEVGIRQLAKAYFNGQRLPVAAAVMKEIDDEEAVNADAAEAMAQA